MIWCRLTEVWKWLKCVGRKTWGECVKNSMKLLGLLSEQCSGTCGDT